MDPWPTEAGMVECTGTALGDVDLHNDCDVLRVSVDLHARAFTILLRHLPTGHRARLRFTGAKVVRIDTVPGGAEDTLHSVDHYPDPLTSRPTFALDLGAVCAVLRASTVTFALLTR
jgi:hypothetical protein